jgi:hypothetical protein
MIPRRVFPLLLSSLLACSGPPSSPSGSASTVATPSTSDATSTSSSASAALPTATSASTTPSAAATPVDPNAAFVRHPPSSNNSDADAVDECTQHGGNYFSCRSAYESEQDPVTKRYLYRIAQGSAAGESGYKHTGPKEDPGSLPHAEVPGMCDPKKPCGAKDESGDLNGATECLARVLASVIANDPAGAKAAHAHACKCNAKAASIPGYNGTPYICDAAGKPAFIAPTLNKREGKEIVACASCDPKDGPAACKTEIDRLKALDAELAAYVATKQVRRCQTANTGPGQW